MNYAKPMDTQNEKGAWLLIILCAIVAGVILPLTQHLAGIQDGDGILTALMSTQHLTWYFWGQDRLLNLLPAIASPVTDIEWNLRFQVFLRSFFAYLSPLGFLVFFSRSPRFLLLATAVTNIILLSALSQYAQFNVYVQHSMFCTSLVLFGMACLLMHANLPTAAKLVLVTLICALMYATNYALLVYALPFAVLMVVANWPDKVRYIAFFACNCIGVVLANLHGKYFGERSTEFGISPSLDALITSLGIIYEHVSIIVVIVAVVVAAALYRRAQVTKPLVLLAGIAAAGGMVLVVCSATWVQMNLYNIRYFLTSVIVVAAVLAAVIAAAMLRWNLSTGRLAGVSLALIAAGSIFALGSFNGAYSTLVGAPWRTSSDAVGEVVVQQQARLVIGGYWDVWPTVYAAEKYEQQHQLPDFKVFGGAYKGHPMEQAFVEQTAGKGDQIAICYLDSAPACVNEARAQLRIPETVKIEVKDSQEMTVLDKRLLRLVIEVVGA
jgi:hypothetical protein